MEQKIYGSGIKKTDEGFIDRDGKPVTCEFCDDPATEHHIDYYTCKEHLHIAVDNVYCRTLP